MGRHERENSYSQEADAPVGSVHVPFGLQPRDFDSKGDFMNPEKEREFAAMLADEKSADKKTKKIAQWFSEFGKDVEAGKRKGWMVPTVGGVTIFVAAVGFEFGLRKGKDVRHLIKLANNIRERMKKENRGEG
ncbi:hypothetical protein HYT33_01505 [Candidatus Roizmanbacteria bacterium]|nr:hypothetical protein [Candidatus Roizmanbacteria bacterium]